MIPSLFKVKLENVLKNKVTTVYKYSQVKGQNLMRSLIVYNSLTANSNSDNFDGRCPSLRTRRRSFKFHE
jgi:hypothetical protein